MVDINLIPPALRRDGKEKAGFKLNISREVLLGVGSLVVFVLVTVHLALGFVWLLGSRQMASYNAQWQAVLPDKNALDAISKESRDLKQKTDTLSGMTVKKSFLWAPIFNEMSDVLPKGVWLRKMTFDKNGLVLDGSVVSKTQSEINNLGLFLAALKQDDDFMKDFASLEVNSIQRGKTDEVEVTDFTVMAKLRS